MTRCREGEGKIMDTPVRLVKVIWLIKTIHLFDLRHQHDRPVTSFSTRQVPTRQLRTQSKNICILPSTQLVFHRRLRTVPSCLLQIFLFCSPLLSSSVSSIHTCLPDFSGTSPPRAIDLGIGRSFRRCQRLAVVCIFCVQIPVRTSLPTLNMECSFAWLLRLYNDCLAA